MAVQIDIEKLAEIQHLKSGAHKNPEDGMCIMEAVAYVTGEPFSDHPECACLVIGAFLRSWNDALPDDERNAIMRPLIAKLPGTRGSKALEERRSLMAADWLVRTHTPAWLRLAGLTEQADALSGLPEITDMAQVPSIRAPIEAARKDAAAARAAAWAAAWDAAGGAAWDAAGTGSWDALKDTRAELQRSALDLVNRMIEATS